MSGLDPFVGEVALFGFDYAPQGWASCDGQLLPIRQNPALYSILGTNFGGDGRITFGLPNLNGRAALGAGSGPGLSSYQVGEFGGQDSVALTQSEMPVHTHATMASSGAATTGAPVNAVPAAGNVTLRTGGEATLTEVLEMAGGGQPHSNMQPSLVMRYCIALAGIYPPRS
ncbi:phage tail protein [Nocardioides sp. Y6]|uniref:Phage tail protein n=1 Tax=Nocardioides malaquae TaxID=2773426 RepID=A0ABR9RXE7_9ACTN|nr:tail fiber protein [Nocardioides malaquae]MBE7325815.1 phage tail protein [Nocardioides malaquae]